MPDITITVANATYTHTMTAEQAQLLADRVEAAKPIPGEPDEDGNMIPIYTIQRWTVEILIDTLRGLNRTGKKRLAKAADAEEENEILGDPE